MASISNQRYLVLLTSPLDTVKSIQEVTGASGFPLHIEDTVCIKRTFPNAPEPTTAVLLEANEAAAVKNWGQRHHAIFTLQMQALTEEDAQEAVRSSQKLNWPSWVFLAGQAPTQSERSIERGLRLETRSAKITGYSYTSSNGSTTITPRAPSPRSDSPKLAAPTSKLRPAQDVLNRMRHDSSVDESDYQVVYEDRFEGEVVLDLELWRTDVSDEEFIPMHRILRFQRKWDQVVVWERSSRTDLIFGDSDSIEGLAVRIHSTEDLERLFAQSADRVFTEPCMIEFTDSAGGTTRGRICK